MRKHIHVELTALVDGVGPQRLTVDADVELREGGAMVVDGDTLALALTPNGDISADGPMVTVGPFVRSTR